MLLILRHHPRQHAGCLAPGFRKHRLAYSYLDLWQDPRTMVDLGQVQRVLILGGDESANDSLVHLERELYLIEDALRRGIPVLGICLGAQMLAKVLGGRVYANRRPEIGWHTIEPTPEGAADPLMRNYSRREPVFQWHAETFDLPRGATLLARSDQCAHQAFRYLDNHYGFQFHLEASPDLIADWLDQDAADPRGPRAAGIDPAAHAARYGWLGETVFAAWMQLKPGRTTGSTTASTTRGPAPSG